LLVVPPVLLQIDFVSDSVCVSTNFPAVAKPEARKFPEAILFGLGLELSKRCMELQGLKSKMAPLKPCLSLLPYR
jgi:hypothetical protein